MQVSVDIPDELALRLNPLQTQLPRILELGLREWNARSEAGFSGLADVLETLASLPSAEEILVLKLSNTLQQQVERLLEKNKTVGLTMEEEKWWQQYEYVEHLVRMAKTRALLKLKTV
ncbi:MAG: hypothetical protein ACPGVO_17670 [Spirulinaceae cyanobacterium]